MQFINFNGKLVEATTAVVGAGNRGLRYGDGLFETIKYRNREPLLIDEHMARLWKGMAALKFNFPKLFTPEMLQEDIHQLALKNKLENARIRLTVTRGDGGLYDTASHNPIYFIQAYPLPESGHELNENGLQLCIYEEARKTTDRFSNLKHNNYLPYFMGALHAKAQQCNDSVILNHHNRVCDSTIANIFIVNQDEITTPPLSEGCIAGVMRSFIIRELASTGIIIREVPVTLEELLQADEVFLSNAIQNIRWVASIENKKYTCNTTRKIFDLLAKTNASIFC